MPKLIMLKGPPGSGKSTWARMYCGKVPDSVKICHDEILFFLFGASVRYELSSTTKEMRAIASKVVGEIAGVMAKEGRNIVVDSLNNTEAHEIYWKEFAKKYEMEFEAKEFTCDDAERGRRIEVRKENFIAALPLFYAELKENLPFG